MSQNHSRLAVLALSVSALAACSSAPPRESVAHVDDLMGWVERVHVETELARETTRTANAMLHQMIAGNFKGDPQLVFAELVSTIEKAEHQALAMGDSVHAMRNSAVSVFAQWEDDLLSYGNPELRQRSSDRLENTRIRYQTLVTAAKSAESQLAAFNRDAMDIALFLRNDFNDSAVAEVSPHVQQVDGMAKEVQIRLVRAMGAAQDYLQTGNLTGNQAGIPAAPPAAAPPGGAPKSMVREEAATPEAAPTPQPVQRQPALRDPRATQPAGGSSGGGRR